MAEMGGDFLSGQGMLPTLGGPYGLQSLQSITLGTSQDTMTRAGLGFVALWGSQRKIRHTVCCNETTSSIFSCLLACSRILSHKAAL